MINLVKTVICNYPKAFNYISNGVKNVLLSMAMPRVQDKAPDFKAMAVVGDDFKEIQLSDYRGKYVLLVFYPLDFTFVCPTELISFDKQYEEFVKLNAEVIGISVDSHFTHLAWMNTDREQGGLGKLRYPLMSDLTKSISKSYGILIEELGVALRGLFIIDPNGIIRQVAINDIPIGRSITEALRTLGAIKYVDEVGEVCQADWEMGDKGMQGDPAGAEQYYKQFKQM